MLYFFRPDRAGLYYLYNSVFSFCSGVKRQSDGQADDSADCRADTGIAYCSTDTRADCQADTAPESNVMPFGDQFVLLLKVLGDFLDCPEVIFTRFFIGKLYHVTDALDKIQDNLFISLALSADGGEAVYSPRYPQKYLQPVFLVVLLAEAVRERIYFPEDTSVPFTLFFKFYGGF